MRLNFLSVSDYANDLVNGVPTQSPFFGDRSLVNPGYSAFTLSGGVGMVGAANAPIDVWRVEQRLKYLGYPAMGQGRAASVITPQNFKVDGTWGDAEAKAAWLFARVVNYALPGSISNVPGTASPKQLVVANRASGGTFNAADYATQLNAASRGFTVGAGAAGTGVTNWLNAWNAPHWVNVGQFTTRSTQWVNTQHEHANDRRENWGTSWMGDWLIAQQYAPAGLQSTLPLLFNGAADANHGQTPSEHSSHDLGMAFDVGIKPRPNTDPTLDFPNAPVDSDITTTGSPASYQMNQAAANAAPTGTQLSLPPGFMGGWSDANAEWFVRPDPRVSFPVLGSTTGQTTPFRNANTAEAADPSQPISANNPAVVYRIPTGQWLGNLKNDQRAVAAEILSLYSITQPQSVGYQTARSHLTGSAADQTVKAENLFGSLFGSIYIGQTATQYNNIKYVLGKLGVPLGSGGPAPGAMPHHEHHFHVTMAVPTLKEIVRSRNLETQPLLKDEDMIDFDTSNVGYLSVSQISPPASLVVAQPNWIGDNQKLLDGIKRRISNPKEISVFAPQVRGQGDLGFPTLNYSIPVEYAPRRGDSGKLVPNAQVLHLATGTCAMLDTIAGEAGNWGPACTITKFIRMPKGSLLPDSSGDARVGDFMYVPRGVGTDTARFIIENGAGKRYDVTVNIKATLSLPEQGGIIESDLRFVERDFFDFTAWQRSMTLTSLFAHAGNAVVGFQNLTGATVGWSTGYCFCQNRL